MFRQGDLLFVPVLELPSETILVADGVIARGEATGHTHRLRADMGNLLMLVAGVAYIKALHEAYVDHEEHDTVVLPEGIWEVRRQREYIPEGWQRVQD